ncbi:MAG: response regulator transcription factor [Elusimicrobia bacterium]|nr:response regulator transcription factor [Elusimicrobiota bacterium]
MLRVLMVDDDARLAGMVKDALEAQGYRFASARTLREGRALLKADLPDVLILDRSLPDGDGLDLCREVKGSPRNRALPVLFLSARRAWPEKVLGLEVGADDYLAKPFRVEELFARLRALVRRCRPPEGPVVSAGPVRVDAAMRLASAAGKKLDLTRLEFDLLSALLASPGRVLTRRQLLETVWGYGPEVDITTRVVDTAVLGLRKKLGTHAAGLETVPGFGYRWTLTES